MSVPRDMLVEFSKVVQSMTENLDREICADEIYSTLIETYQIDEPYCLIDYEIEHHSGRDKCRAELRIPDGQVRVAGEGSGPIEAFVNAMVETLNEPLNIIDYHEHALDTGKDATAICIVAIDVPDSAVPRCYGIGLSTNTVTASLTAIVSAVNRRWRGVA